MTTYKYDREKGEFVDAAGKPMLSETEKNRPIGAPMIIKDVTPHMFRGHYVGSRAAQRELAKTQGFVPFEPVSERARAMPKSDYDKRDDNWQDFMHTTKEKVAKAAGLTKEQSELEAKARKVTPSLREKIKAKQAKEQKIILA